MVSRIFFLVGLAAALAATPAAAQTACPAGHGAARRAAQAFFISPSFTEARHRLGLTGVRSDDLRVLEMPGDAEACARLNALFGDSRYTRPPYRRSYYAAGGFYFVAFFQEREPGHRFTLGRSPLVILDGEFRVVSVT